MITSIDPAAVTRALQAVSAASGVPVEELRSSKRFQHMVDARQLVYWVLRTQGHTMSAIGRALDKDHATVWHGINRIANNPELLATGRYIAAGIIPPKPPAMLEQSCGPAARVIHEYLRALAGQGPMRTYAVVAVHCIAADPELQGMVRGILAAHGYDNQYWRIAAHARQLGYSWAATGPQLADGYGR